MRIFATVGIVLLVAACAPKVPDSSAGVGFDGYASYQQNRGAEPSGFGAIQLGVEISDEVLAAETDSDITAGTTAVTASATETATTGAPLDATAPDTAPETAATDEVLPTVQLNRDNPTLSDEQDFEAVTARETIESDAARRAAQQQAYQVIEPTALPTRQGGSGAAIVEFALATTNLVGQSIYRRSSLFSANRFQRNCAKYPSSDLAQVAFLKNGGPERDRQGIDPDGDGFACFWDPTPFRQAVRN